MKLLQIEILKALSYLLMAGLIYVVWNTAREETIKSNFKSILFKGFLLVVFIAFSMSITMGSPTCEESEPLYGGCNQYTDDGYKPTTEQRTTKFAFYMILFFIPVVMGTLKGKKEKEIMNYSKNKEDDN
jgi:hypothetical protein